MSSEPTSGVILTWSQWAGGAEAIEMSCWPPPSTAASTHRARASQWNLDKDIA